MAIVNFWAHSANGDGRGIPESLAEHLRRVATCAAEFAGAFGADRQACLAGILHDVGKYAEKFQKYLLQQLPRAGDHWSAGSLLALKFAGDYGLYPALAIEGHHSGLSLLKERRQFWNELVNRLRNANGVTHSRVDELFRRFSDDGLSVPKVENGFSLNQRHLVAAMLDLRMLFSALVDADFLETEAHFEGDAQTPRRPRPSGPLLDHTRAIRALEDYLEELRRSHPTDPLNSLRDELQTRCREIAGGAPGAYTLSAPTGLGKTLAMLTFALYHARAHNLRRIIVVMPYINIIDQTVRIYRRIFSPERGFPEGFVLEHHSGHDEPLDEGETEGSLRRLLAENWDAPIIVTTNVQFFESLFANGPARCRKLHRIARSVILFDEVQTLPVHLAVATLAALSRLTERTGPYGCTCVFATATQPAFTVLHQRVQKFAPAGWQPTELIPEAEKFFRATAHRVKTTWRHEEPVHLADLAQELAQHRQVMCIVNLKRHAVELFRHLKECLPAGEQPSLLHLSTALCPLHRRDVLAEINRRLADQRPLRLVATQCVEAGVDLDFPVVYRALAPLEAIAQAAGRCNRHGRRSAGTLVVFTPIDEKNLYPPGYESAAEATLYYLKQLRREDPAKLAALLSNPDGIRRYFEVFYSVQGYANPQAILAEERELLDAIGAGDFEVVAKCYRLISQRSLHVLVPYERSLFEGLLDEVRNNPGKPGWLRRWCRRATQITVEIFPPKADSSNWNHLEPIEFFRSRGPSRVEATWYRLLPSLAYDPQLGLVFPEEDNLSFIV